MSENVAYQQSPSSTGSSLDSPGASHSTAGNSQLALSTDSIENPLIKVQSAPVSTNHPPSKTDKPRPHICGTCQRSFARLEHLKRHERSHTKEKPFECPECTRCFARRDLLLRHQQKLHLTTTPSTKASKARRDSVTGPSSSKVRKNSAVAGSSGVPARQRANTISHVDGRTLGILQGMHRQMNEQANQNNFGYNQYLGPGQVPQFAPSGMQGVHPPHGLSRLDTHGFEPDVEPSLRTAPPLNGNFMFHPLQNGGSTVNPAQLHMGEDNQNGAFHQMDTAMMEEDEKFEWMQNFHAHQKFQHGQDQALHSSPSMMSHGSDVNMRSHDGFASPQEQAMMWQRHPSLSGPMADHSGVSIPSDMDMGIDPMSPNHFQGQQRPDHFFHQPPPQINTCSPQSAMNGFQQQLPHHFMYNSDGTSVSSMSMNGSSGRHSSVTSVSTDTITEITRQALLMSLSQPQQLSHGTRKFSQPAVSSPLRDTARGAISGASLPSTQDLQRFVGAYIQYFHPHFPFLHVPTLSFDTPAYTNNLRFALSSGSSSAAPQPQVVGGGGCLVLAMAAIGALYEQDRAASKELFDAAKKLIQLYLEERRKADGKREENKPPPQTTPLWLVQAMLLNVIYGHNCSDKVSGDIAETHCAALISLARSAGLLTPLAQTNFSQQQYYNGHRLSPVSDASGPDHIQFNNPFSAGISVPDENHQWRRWVVVEERKRALYAIFHMSSLLVASYNHPPALMNSEVQLDLPCEESLWNAESADAWMSLGGQQAADNGAIPFANALGLLLTASQSHGHQGQFAHKQTSSLGIPRQELPPTELRPSTFGCLSLIDALHNYIWETRQRHSGRQWTTQETESMHAHIEPALRAWQSAWAANPAHSLERPNPHGVGPLSADCIPLLDLAYVRLFVSFGAAKEAFWQRDFDLMSEELARGSEFVQHADHSDPKTEGVTTANGTMAPPKSNGLANGEVQSSLAQPGSDQSQPSKRERQLRKAACYAADSLSMADKLNVTFADFTSRELPLQAGLCTFDCAQILAEWVSTLQERVGRYLGILGREQIDYTNVPSIMLLEETDCDLLKKIEEILHRAELKMTRTISSMQGSAAVSAMHRLPSHNDSGFGSKILMVTSHMFERNEIWPVFGVMADGLTAHAEHMLRRAENSTKQPQSS